MPPGEQARLCNSAAKLIGESHGKVPGRRNDYSPADALRALARRMDPPEGIKILLEQLNGKEESQKLYATAIALIETIDRMAPESAREVLSRAAGLLSTKISQGGPVGDRHNLASSLDVLARKLNRGEARAVCGSAVRKLIEETDQPIEFEPITRAWAVSILAKHLEPIAAEHACNRVLRRLLRERDTGPWEGWIIRVILYRISSAGFLSPKPRL